MKGLHSLTKYDDLLKEAKSKLSAIQQSTARDYIPRMYAELRKENSDITPEDARDRIEKDCVGIWGKRTILQALPDEAKDVKKQKAGRIRQKEAKCAAVTAAPEAKRQIILDAQGQSICYDTADERIESFSTRHKGFDEIKKPISNGQTAKCSNCLESDIKIRELEEALNKATVLRNARDIPNTSSNTTNRVVQFEFELPLETVRRHIMTNFNVNKIRDKVQFYGSLDLNTGKVVTADVGCREQDILNGKV
jgi:hypothetical protein